MISSSKEIGWRGKIPRRRSIQEIGIPSWQQMMILLSMAVSLWNTLQDKAVVFSDEQYSIRWFEVKAYYVVIQGKGFFDDLKVELVPDFNPFILLILVSFSAVKDWTYIFFMIETKKLFDDVPSCHIYSLQKCNLKARTFTLFLNTYVIRGYFQKRPVMNKTNMAVDEKPSKGMMGK